MNIQTGLLVIDAQEDFLNHPDLAPHKQQLVKSIGTILSWARAHDIPIFHVHTLVAEDGSNAMPHWKIRAQFKCKIGSAGVRTPALLTPLASEQVFDKQFFNAFDNPALIEALKLGDINKLIVTGLHTHACIRESVVEAYARGIKVVVVRDAVGSYDPLHASHTLEWLNGRVASCLCSTELMKNWQAPNPGDQETSTWIQHNPCNTEEILFEVMPNTHAQIESIAQSIGLAQTAWAKLPIKERTHRLQNWLAILKERENLWIDTLIRDVGKPFIDAQSEVKYGFNLLESACLNPIDREPSANHEIYYRPHGVVALITPWNNPFAIPISKLGPALIFGNSALWKPALPASHISELILDSLQEANLSNFVGLITGGVNAGQHVIKSRYVSAVSFTGSLANGNKVANMSRNLGKPLQAELGGNNAAIVLSDANLSEVAEDLATAMFSFAGQRCTAIRRVIVETKILGEFKSIFKAAIESLKVGNPTDSDTQIGPIISPEHHQFLLNQINQAKDRGIGLLTEEKVPKALSLNGNWLMPSVFINPPTSSPIWTDELFGTVVALQECSNLNTAIALHNGVGQGLLGVLYSNNKDHQDQFIAQAQAGQLSINKARPSFSVTGPFVGWKHSGMGVPEHGRWNRDFYTKPQMIYRNLSNA